MPPQPDLNGFQLPPRPPPDAGVERKVDWNGDVLEQFFLNGPCLRHAAKIAELQRTQSRIKAVLLIAAGALGVGGGSFSIWRWLL